MGCITLRPMALTRIDSSLYRGRKAADDASSYVSLNPLARPSQLVFAGATAIRSGLGSQVAYRLALDYFMKGVESHYVKLPAQELSSRSDESVVSVIEDAFRSANSSVYSFGHKLAAGGRMSASLLGLVIESGRLSTGRVGYGSVYLFRKKQLFPFFEHPERDESTKVGDAAEFPDEATMRQRAFVGSNSIVDVELASVVLEPGDVLCVFSRPLTSLNETLLFECLETLHGEGFPDDFEGGVSEVAERICNDVFTEPESLSFAAIISVGPDVIYCDQVVVGV
jgi:hypothetical protein